IGMPDWQRTGAVERPPCPRVAAHAHPLRWRQMAYRRQRAVDGPAPLGAGLLRHFAPPLHHFPGRRCKVFSSNSGGIGLVACNEKLTPQHRRSGSQFVSRGEPSADRSFWLAGMLVFIRFFAELVTIW